MAYVRSLKTDLLKHSFIQGGRWYWVRPDGSGKQYTFMVRKGGPDILIGILQYWKGDRFVQASAELPVSIDSLLALLEEAKLGWL